MIQPEGFIAKGQEHRVCKLQRSIYGLIQASRSWNIIFDQAVKSIGFRKSIDESCVYSKIKDGKVVFLIPYVDDIVIIRNDVESLTSVKMWLTK